MMPYNMTDKNTDEFLCLTAVLDLDVRLSGPADDLEGEVLDIRLHFGVIELAADETLGVKDPDARSQYSM